MKQRKQRIKWSKGLFPNYDDPSSGSDSEVEEMYKANYFHHSYGMSKKQWKAIKQHVFKDYFYTFPGLCELKSIPCLQDKKSHHGAIVQAVQGLIRFRCWRDGNWFEEIDKGEELPEKLPNPSKRLDPEDEELCRWMKQVKRVIFGSKRCAPMTIQEWKALRQGVLIYGSGNWAQIKNAFKIFENRTEKELERYFYKVQLNYYPEEPADRAKWFYNIIKDRAKLLPQRQRAIIKKIAKKRKEFDFSISSSDESEGEEGAGEGEDAGEGEEKDKGQKKNKATKNEEAEKVVDENEDSLQSVLSSIREVTPDLTIRGRIGRDPVEMVHDMLSRWRKEPKVEGSENTRKWSDDEIRTVIQIIDDHNASIFVRWNEEKAKYADVIGDRPVKELQELAKRIRKVALNILPDPSSETDSEVEAFREEASRSKNSRHLLKLPAKEVKGWFMAIKLKTKQDGIAVVKQRIPCMANVPIERFDGFLMQCLRAVRRKQLDKSTRTIKDNSSDESVIMVEDKDPRLSAMISYNFIKWPKPGEVNLDECEEDKNNEKLQRLLKVFHSKCPDDPQTLAEKFNLSYKAIKSFYTLWEISDGVQRRYKNPLVCQHFPDLKGLKKYDMCLLISVAFVALVNTANASKEVDDDVRMIQKYCEVYKGPKEALMKEIGGTLTPQQIKTCKLVYTSATAGVQKLRRYFNVYQMRFPCLRDCPSHLVVETAQIFGRALELKAKENILKV